jgi:hypothetical protein
MLGVLQSIFSPAARRQDTQIMRGALRRDGGLKMGRTKPLHWRAIRNAFAQFAIIPVLHTGQDQRPEDLLRGQAAPAGLPVLQAALEVAANAVDDVALGVEEVRDRFERLFQLDTLLDELQVRETDLGSLLSHDWSPCA